MAQTEQLIGTVEGVTLQLIAGEGYTRLFMRRTDRYPAWINMDAVQPDRRVSFTTHMCSQLDISPASANKIWYFIEAYSKLNS